MSSACLLSLQSDRTRTRSLSAAANWRHTRAPSNLIYLSLSEFKNKKKTRKSKNFTKQEKEKQYQKIENLFKKDKRDIRKRKQSKNDELLKELKNS
ncbi:unnamed protein product [Oikopleura dioica]|uniref:Uncharacterized protein n=1 Tax=Oikopleura dioica TaxID=34765 RepID=E4YD00_OIKDI|nr:unnamed protein product [Oikopleura dioica]